MRNFNSTIQRKKKRCKSCGNMDYIFSHGRCVQCAKVESVMQQDEEENNDIERDSWQNLRDDCDTVFSLYIRNRYASKDGLVRCFICQKELPIGQIHNGHYISRSNLITRWLDKNCKPNCPTCNFNHETNMEPFKRALESETPGITSYLEELSREVYKPTISDLKQTLSELKYKLSLVKNK